MNKSDIWLDVWTETAEQGEDKNILNLRLECIESVRVRGTNCCICLIAESEASYTVPFHSTSGAEAYREMVLDKVADCLALKWGQKYQREADL